MTVSPANPEDDERLDALRNYNILDSLPESDYDAITELAAQICQTPIALLSFVDQDRQWFKSSFGIEDMQETPRDISFCGHAVAMAKNLIVPDALKDPRFADNPMVVGQPYIRFYAGALLRLPYGQVVGTLCVMDRRPREFDKLDEAILNGLRDLVVEELFRREEAVS